MNLDGSSAIVTGGAGGLGGATVRRLAAAGVGVVIADLADDSGKALADEVGGRTRFVHTDVTSEDSLQAAIEQALDLGPLRIAVSAHGGAAAPRPGRGAGRQPHGACALPPPHGSLPHRARTRAHLP